MCAFAPVKIAIAESNDKNCSNYVLNFFVRSVLLFSLAIGIVAKSSNQTQRPAVLPSKLTKESKSPLSSCIDFSIFDRVDSHPEF
jgi:hypothetical protein